MGGVLVADVVFPSENNKLKKLGKYFTKGLQAGALATALIAGNVSCSQPAGGNGTEFTGGNGGNGGEQEETGWKQPAYMNITEEFGGQRFVESNADWFKDNQYDKDTKFIERYDDANQYIDCKVAELNKLWQEKNTGSTLSDQIGTALGNFNNGATINDKIYNRYDVLAPIYKAMAYTLVDGNKNTDFHSFNLSYQKLAADAYNKSIGFYGSNEEAKKDFTTNTEMAEDDIFIATELSGSGLDYADATNRTNAKNRMNNYLSTIAAQTDTDIGVLKKVVELALYNESLYGLNDFAARCNVSDQGLTNTQRRLDIFYTKIKNAITYSVSNIQNIDDRTM